MIHITRAAQKHLHALLSRKTHKTQIRASVVDPGTRRQTFNVSYCSKQSMKKYDLEIKFKKFSVFIDQLSFIHLGRAEIGLLPHSMGFKLVLKIPKPSRNPSTEKTLLFEEIQRFLDRRVNPGLRQHRGRVELVRIVDAKTAVLEFFGECRGCSMAQWTFTHHVTRMLLNEFPDLRKVRDVTRHTPRS